MYAYLLLHGFELGLYVLLENAFALNTYKYYIHNLCFGFYYPHHIVGLISAFGLNIGVVWKSFFNPGKVF